MRPPPERQALSSVAERLSELLGSKAELKPPRGSRGPKPDAVFKVGGTTFIVEWKQSGTAGSVAEAAEQVRRYAAALRGRVVPLVVVPFMGQAGRDICDRVDVAWLDLSGNAKINAPGIRVLLSGHPNRFRPPGRPSSVFAPKSARIVRWLLIHPDKPVLQRELARATGMDEGFTSRIVSRLLEAGLIVRRQDGTVLPRDPNLMLDAWREEYDFSKHDILRGHVPARSGDALLRQLAGSLGALKAEYAATGLPAAWLLTKFAGFRLVTIYLSERPGADLLHRLDFREDDRGANVWLVIPNDQGVFHGGIEREDVRCVHPVQVYLDLKGQPERAQEAAAELRAQLLKWEPDAGQAKQG